MGAVASYVTGLPPEPCRASLPRRIVVPTVMLAVAKEMHQWTGEKQ